MSFISSIFGGGKKQAPPPPAPDAPAPPPTVDNAAAMAQDQEDRLAKRKGSAATILVPTNGDITGNSLLGSAGALLG
jgi:hypothetical protein